MESTKLIMDPADHLGSSFLGCYDEDDQGFWDDESSYIEIALEPAAPNKHTTNYDHDDGDDDDDDEYRESSDHNGLQLRISFSSTVPFACPSSTAGEILPENSSSVSDHDKKACKVQKSTTTIKSRSVHQFPAAVNRFLNTILSSRPEIATSSRKLGSNISKRMEGGGGMMMQFLMKLRSKNIGALMESLLIRPAVQHHHQVAAHVSSSPPKKKKRPGTGSGNNVITQRIRKSGKKVLLGNSSGVLEINLMGGLKKGVLVNRVVGLGRRSNGSSPVHPRKREMMSRSGGDQYCSNIQAAIAHCKSSYGDDDVHLSDFQFQTQRTDR